MSNPDGIHYKQFANRNTALTFFLALAFVGCLNLFEVNAQAPGEQVVPNVYLDCGQGCSETYVRTNVTFVNYVRDQADADIYLRITSASTGSGSEFILDFRGIPPFSTRRDTLVYQSPNTDTSDEQRTGLVRHVRLGLVPFAANTPAMASLDVIYEEPEEVSSKEVVTGDLPIVDPWRNWVFDVDLGASVDGEESESSTEIEAGFAAERITEMWKIDVNLEYELDREEIELSSGPRKVNRDSWEYDSFIGYSIGSRFSLGFFSQINASRTGNIDFNIEASPALEYSFFPYQQFQERQLVFQYRVTPAYRRYHETTVYLKDEEHVTQQVLSADLRYDQPWGRIDIGVSGSNYLHDISINSFDVFSSFDIRITRGLSVNFSARYELINDQISLPAEEISDEELLLDERQQATSYEYGISFGLSYTFGSQFSNVVNPRF